MELGPYFCSASLDHPNALLRRRYLWLYLSLARMVLYTRVKFRPLPSSNGNDDTTPLYYYAMVIV